MSPPGLRGTENPRLVQATSEHQVYLVTGGAGFIGSHLVDELLARGHRVLAIDDLSTGSIENLSHVIDSADFEFTRGSITDDGVRTVWWSSPTLSFTSPPP